MMPPGGAGAGDELQLRVNGNVLSDGTRTYAWDGSNRLLSVTDASGTVSFQYDAAAVDDTDFTDEMLDYYQ